MTGDLPRDGRVPVPALRWRFDPAAPLPDPPPEGCLVGQDGVLAALVAAIRASRAGRHTFVAGARGSGRRSAARRLLAEAAARPPSAWPRRDLVLAPDPARPNQAGWQAYPAGGSPRGPVEPPAEPRTAPRVLVTSAPEGAAPVEDLLLPTWERLLGGVVPAKDGAGWLFETARPGALLRADGGFVLIDADAVAAEPGLWKELLRVLAAGATDLRVPPSKGGASPLDRPIPLGCTVLAFGSAGLLQEVRATEAGRAAFPFRADAARDLPRTPAVLAVARAAALRIAAAESAIPLDPGATGPLVEELSRAAGGRDRVSAAFGRMREWIREAEAVVAERGVASIEPSHVEDAVERLRDRGRTRYPRVVERVARGLTRLDLGGSRIGVVNSLLVWTGEEASYGGPARITASVAVGREGVINIEREARLSGSTWDKGLLILGGLLRSRFAGSSPLSLVASLAMEQNYGRIDGDSASLAEWVALLSEIAAVPVRQDLAVTGSVNQKGEAQPIGSVVEKVEGFFAACRARGLTGSQGVVLPRANVPDLMLGREVVDACAAGEFHLYAVDDADEAVALLTGREPGARDARGRYPKGSVHALAAARLARMAARLHPQRKDRKPPAKRGAAAVPAPAAADPQGRGTAGR